MSLEFFPLEGIDIIKSYSKSKLNPDEFYTLLLYVFNMGSFNNTDIVKLIWNLFKKLTC